MYLSVCSLLAVYRQSGIRLRQVLSFLGRRSLLLYVFSPVFTLSAKALVPFLSFDPVREEILGAVSEMGEAIRKVFVDAQDPTEILMLEDFKDSMERLVESGAAVYMVGEAINVEGVIKVPEERAAELLK